MQTRRGRADYNLEHYRHCD